MKILTAQQIREADSYTIAHEPVKSIDLMERAAVACFEWIFKKFGKNFSFKIFCGVGNNGGDGLVIARKLFESGCDVEVFIVRFSEKCSEDFLINEQRLRKLNGVKVFEITNSSLLLSTTNYQLPTVIIDALFGSGLSRPVSGIAADVIREINKSNAMVISIDVPSGLFCEDNSNNKNIINANYTLTFELPKLSFLFPENNIDEWYIIPIGLSQKFIAAAPSKYFLTTKETAKKILKPRKKFSHKGTFGHALLISGSIGKMGASVLCTRACTRAGAGLTTVHIPKCGYEILQTAVPEAMVNIDGGENCIADNIKPEKYNSIGIGPGIGTEKQTQNILKLLIQNSKLPLVIDADAINIISGNKTWLSFVPQKSIFTPHPKEFERLVRKSTNNFERMKMQIEFSKKYNVYVVLKGAHTCISCPDGEVFFNSTGNPGMATGGSGDVLTGIITALLAQNYSPKEAAILGVFIHGLAGDLAAEKNGILIANDIIEHIGKAFLSLK